MNISQETVRYVANLARIELTEAELEKFSHQLNDILRYIDQLKEVDISKVSPASHVLEVKNVTRKDQLCLSLKSDEALKNAPQKQGKFFKVPKVIE